MIDNGYSVMQWTIPPRIKVLEALGSLADDRLVSKDTETWVYSSSGNKYYTVTYNPDSHVLSCNDNGSYWQGYVGYPAIAVLMQMGILPYEERYAKALAGIAWKEINQRFANDFAKTERYLATEVLPPHGIVWTELAEYADTVCRQIGSLGLIRPAKRVKPPSGW